MHTHTKTPTFIHPLGPPLSSPCIYIHSELLLLLLCVHPSLLPPLFAFFSVLIGEYTTLFLSGCLHFLASLATATRELTRNTTQLAEGKRVASDRETVAMHRNRKRIV